MNKYEKASEDINKLIRKGIKYAEALKPVIPMLKSAKDNIFIYWNPETGHYAIKPVKEDEQIEKDAAVGFYKAGFAMKADFNKDACEENGWVCLYGPKDYKPIEKLKKYANMAYSPAGMAIAGALLTGGSLGAFKLLTGEEETASERINHAFKVLALGGLLGVLPGLLSAAGVTSMTHGDLPFGKAFFTPYEDIPKESPYYNFKLETEKRGSYKEGSLWSNSLFDTGVVDVDAFNRITWDAAKTGTMDMNNAILTNSLLNATSARTGTGLVSPSGIAGTLINAGIGNLTSKVIGKTLGAMGMISPASQNKLVELGTWGGLLQGVGNALR